MSDYLQREFGQGHVLKQAQPPTGGGSLAGPGSEPCCLPGAMSALPGPPMPVKKETSLTIPLLEEALLAKLRGRTKNQLSIAE